MQVRHLLVAMLVGAGSAQGATEFGDTIPTELAKAFMGADPNGGQVQLYSDIVDGFPEFTIPQGFTLLGSVERGGAARSVYLQTGQDTAQARTAVEQALQAAGWQTLAMPGRPAMQQQAGFVGDNLPAFPSSLCHDEHGNLQLSSLPRQGGALVVLSLQDRWITRDPSQTCSEMVVERNLIVGRRAARQANDLQIELPRLELPPEGSTGRPYGGTGRISSGGDEATASTPMQIDWDLAAVTAHFSAQVSAQGWIPQGEWDTGVAAGGSWIRTGRADGDLIGMLNVIRKAPGDYLLEFRVLLSPQTNGD